MAQVPEVGSKFETKIGQVGQQAQHLNVALKRHEDRLMELQQRLEPILMEWLTMDETAKAAEPEALVPHAQYLFQQAARLDRLDQWLADLIKRIEL